MVTGTSATDTATASCPAGKVAVGGGGSSTNANNQLEASFPVLTATTPTGWTVRFDGAGGTQTAYVICAN